MGPGEVPGDDRIHDDVFPEIRPVIQGLSHITLIVADLDQTAAFLARVFDAKEVYRSGVKQFSHAKEAFFLIGGIWLCAMEGRPSPGNNYSHIAFSITKEDLALYRARLEEAGVSLLPSRPRAAGEGDSLYFYDPDGYLYELHDGSLDERLMAYKADGDPGAD